MRIFSRITSIVDDLHVIAEQAKAKATHSEGTQADNEQCPNGPLSVNIKSSPDPHAEVLKYYQSNRNKQPTWTKLKPWVEFFGVAIGAMVLVANSCTLNEIRKQTPKIAESSDATKAATDVELAINKPQIGFASVYFTNAKRLKSISKGIDSSITVEFYNFGQIPANGTYLAIDETVSPDAPKLTIDGRPHYEHCRCYGLTVWPSTANRVTTSIPDGHFMITGDVMKEITKPSPSTYIWIYGYVDYRVLPSRRAIFRFCTKWGLNPDDSGLTDRFFQPAECPTQYIASPNPDDDEYEAKDGKADPTKAPCSNTSCKWPVTPKP